MLGIGPENRNIVYFSDKRCYANAILSVAFASSAMS